MRRLPVPSRRARRMLGNGASVQYRTTPCLIRPGDADGGCAGPAGRCEVATGVGVGPDRWLPLPPPQVRPLAAAPINTAAIVMLAFHTLDLPPPHVRPRSVRGSRGGRGGCVTRTSRGPAQAGETRQLEQRCPRHAPEYRNGTAMLALSDECGRP